MRYLFIHQFRYDVTVLFNFKTSRVITHDRMIQLSVVDYYTNLYSKICDRMLLNLGSDLALVAHRLCRITELTSKSTTAYEN